MVKSIKINFLVKKILIWWNKRFFKPGVISFAEKMIEAENVLICLPSKIESFDPAKDHLKIFTDIFPNKKISVFLPFTEGDPFLSHFEEYIVIYPQKDDLGIFSLPGKKLIQRIKDHHFQIALDLDLENAFFNSYLCLKSGAEMRIGLKDKFGFPFHNLQLTLSKDRLRPEELYVRMVEMLKSLLHGTGKGKEN